MVKTFTLSNGIKVVTYKMNQVKSIHVNVTVKGGSLVEEKEKNGVAHFMEHMLVQGIPSFPNVESLSTYVESLAGSYNAFTSQLTVSFIITLPFIHLAEALKISSEVMFAPLFPENVIEKERKAVITEITQRKDSLGYKLGKEFKKTRFIENSEIQKEIGGNLETIQKITRKDLIDYWEKYFIPENTYIYIGGNFSEKKLRNFLEKYFEKYSASKKFSGYPALSKNDFANRKIILKEDKKLGTNYVALSFPSINLETHWKDIVLQDIALTTLGQLRTSRLFKLLRYEKGLVYGVGAQRVLMPKIGYVDIGCETATEHIKEVMTLITKTIKEYITNGPTKEELEFVKHYYVSTWLMAFDNPASVAEWLEEEILWEEKVKMPEENIRMIKNIKQKDVLSVMQKYWDLSKLQLLIQGPLESTDSLEKHFEELLSIL
ncbi:MAG TPA: pitrilysin family protein [Patescibacteria group bacterium]